MPEMILNAEQARVVAEAKESVEVRDPQGQLLGFFTVMDPIDAEVVLRYKRTRHLPKKLIPAAQVEAHLRRLEEISQQEPLDESKVLDLLRRMRAGEEV
jgi:hypothetical protein